MPLQNFFPPAKPEEQPPTNTGGLFPDTPTNQPPAPKGPDTNWLNPAGAAGAAFNYTFGAPTNDFMAIGKTPKGEAYYGEGFQGWARKTWAKMTDPTRHGEGLDFKQSDAIDAAAKLTSEQWAKDNPGIANYKDFVYSTTRAASLDKAAIDQGGLAHVAVNDAAMLATGAADTLFGGVMQVAASATRNLTDRGRTLEDQTNKDSTMGDIPTATPLKTENQLIDNAASIASEMNPVKNSWNLIRYAGTQLQKGNIGGAILSTILSPVALSAGPLSKAVAGISTLAFQDAQQKAETERNLTGANTIFTQMFDGQAKAEIQRAIAAGENPTFIEERLSNPWVEAAGGILTDPLTYEGGIFGHGAHTAAFLKDATDVTKALPEIEKLAQVGLDSGHSGVQAFEYLKSAVGAIDKVINGKFENLSKLVNVNNLEHLTSSGKQFMLNRQLGSFEKFIVGQFKDPEEAVGIFKTLASYAVSADEASKAEHLTTLMSSPVGKAALSGPGVTWMGFAKKFLETTDETGAKTYMPVEKFVDDLITNGKKGETAAEQVMNMAEYAGKKMESATAQLFPSVDDMEKAAKVVKDGGKVTAETERLAGMLKDVPDYVRKVNGALGRSSAVHEVYNKFNGFFAGVYMGLSPAFAVRNVLSNSVGIFADQGLGTTLDITKNALQSFFDKGASYNRYLTGMAAALGGAESMPVDLQNLASFTKEVGSGFGALGWSNAAEKTTRAGIYYHAITETMDNFFRNGGMPEVSTLTDAGMTPSQASTYTSMLQKNFGNVERTAVDFSTLMEKSGHAIPEWRQVEPNPRLVTWLNSFGLGKQLLDDVKFGEHDTPESISAAVKKFRDSLQSASDQALSEPVFPGDGSPESQLANLGQGIGKGLKNADEVSQAYTTGMGVFQSAREAAYDAADKVFRDLQAQFRTSNIPPPQNFSDALTMLNAAKKEMLGPEVAGGINAWKSLAAQVVNDVKSGTMTTDQALAALGKKLPGEFQVDIQKYTAGLDLTQNFGDRLYQDIQPALMSDWWQHFGEHQQQAVSNAITLATGDPTVSQNVLSDARQHLRDSIDIFDQIHSYKASGGGGSVLNEHQMAQGAVNDLITQAKKAGWNWYKGGLLSKIQETHPEITSLVDAYNATGRKGQLIREALLTDAEKSGLDTAKFNAVPEVAARRMRDTTKVTLENLTPQDATAKYMKELKDDILKQADIHTRSMLTHDPNPPEKRLLGVLNKAGKEYKNLYDATPQELIEALNEYGGKKIDLTRAADQALLASVQKGESSVGSLDSVANYRASYGGTEGLFSSNPAKSAEQLAQEAEPFKVKTTILADAHTTAQHTIPGTINKQLPGVLEDLNKYEQEVLSKFGKIGEAGKPMDGNSLRALEQFNQIVKERLVAARQTGIELGRQKADFAIHAYGDKTHADTALAMLMPYHYWQGRTYAKWMQRMAYRPDLMAAYGKYRHALEVQHAGLPDWWKYNITSNDVLGTNSDNPMYFNLEATLNPLNGITGVDFNDSKKRVDWTSRAVDDLGKFGPSLFTPIQWLMAGSLYAKGETDAANRWTGRAIPQTQQLKQLINATGIQAPQIGSYGKYGEYDPFVNLFQGGLDPYERPKVGRALGTMQDEQVAAINSDSSMSQAQKDDAIGTLKAQFDQVSAEQKGPVWEQAVQKSESARAPGALASYLFGVGFKNRSVNDVQIDKFYTNYYQLMAASANINPEQFRQGMSQLQKQYPWMDTVLISRKTDDDRQTAYAYNVLGRIPPGQSGDLLKKAGITSDLMNRFYGTKGTFKGWTPQDVSRFNAGIADLGTLLAMPDDNTKQEWDAARTQYGHVTDAMKAQYGADILDKVDLYFNKQGDDQKQYIQMHPELQGAFNFKSSAYASDPLLYRYYGGLENLTKYYKSQMYTNLEAKYGKDIQAKFDEYSTMKLEDSKKAGAYWRTHPELGQYSKEKKLWDDYILRQSVAIGAKMPSGPEIPVRNDFAPQSQVQQDLSDSAQPQNKPTWDDFKGLLSTPMQRLVADYWIHGSKLSASVQSQLDYTATHNGFKDGDALLQAIGISLQQLQGQP